MTTFCNKLPKLNGRLERRERGAFAIEQALFTSAAGAGCVVLSTQLANAIEHGLTIIHLAMP